MRQNPKSGFYNNPSLGFCQSEPQTRKVDYPSKKVMSGAPRGQCRSNHRRGKTHHQKLCQLAIPTRTSNCWHHHHHHQQVIWVARKEIYSFLCTHRSPQLTTTVTSSHFQSGTERRRPETMGFPLIATLSTLILRRCVAINRDKSSFLVTPT